MPFADSILRCFVDEQAESAVIGMSFGKGIIMESLYETPPLVVRCRFLQTRETTV